MGQQLTTLKFKDYIWPHNPSLYDIRFVKNFAEHQYLNISGSEFEDFGIGARVFSGSGAFFGINAYAQFGQLATVFYEKGPGILIHPIWQPTFAVFTSLTVKQEPTPNYVEYDFEFMEHRDIDVIKEFKNPTGSVIGGTKPVSKSVTHTVKSGESLSYIASLYGVTWRQIADDNKKLIKNPNVLQIGWKLVINNPAKIPSASAKKKVSIRAKDKPVYQQKNSQFYRKGE